MLALAVIGIYIGAAKLGFKSILASLMSRLLPFLKVESDRLTSTIVWDLRFPRIVMAVLAGAGLALSGATMQGVLHNPLISPFTLGISAAAGFGAALAIVAGVGIAGAGQILIIGNAFIFALLAVLLVFFLARLRGVSSITLILSGIAVMYMFSALTSLLQYMATSDELSGVVFWLMGSLATASWTKNLLIFIVLAAVFPFLLRFSWDLNVMASGDQTAGTLGTNVKLVMTLSMVLSALMAAAIVCFTGVIGFIGLVAPHIARLLIGGDHRFLLPASTLLGAVFLLFSDTLARTLFAPSELPLGIVTSLFGVPFFIYILLIRRKEYFS